MRFEIDPLPNESRRGSAAIVKATLPPSRADVLLLAFIGAIWAGAHVLAPEVEGVVVLTALIAVIGSVTIVLVYAKRRIRALKSSDPHADEHYFIELGPDGLHSGCQHVDARYPWKDFQKITENGEFYLLCRGNGSGAAVPKRLLSAQADSALRSALQEWGGARCQLAREAR